jgi:hypothetical protein
MQYLGLGRQTQQTPREPQNNGRNIVVPNTKKWDIRFFWTDIGSNIWEREKERNKWILFTPMN